MTGTIVGLTSGERTGTIRTLEGVRVSFAASAVLGDFDTLAVGHRVSFDFDRIWPKGGASRVMREPTRASVPRRADAALDLRYAGFDQAANLRGYRFEAIEGGQSTRQFIVKVDLALLLKHRIGVQEAPALCLRRLATDLKDAPEAQMHQLNNDDLLAYVATRAAATERKRPKTGFSGRRGTPPPGPWHREPATG